MDYLGSIMERLDLVDDAEPIIGDEIRIWIDWIFTDQNHRDIEAELDVLPDIIDSCSAHFVLSSTALTRAWCCWEIGRFNQRFGDDTAVPGVRWLHNQPMKDGQIRQRSTTTTSWRSKRGYTGICPVE